MQGIHNYELRIRTYSDEIGRELSQIAGTILKVL